jgi:glycosyltransferase involved in cell wall biosynthesis
MATKIKICFISVCHGAFDDRIYKKEALSLSRNGFEVCHLCYGDSNEKYVTENNIQIIQLQKRRKGASIHTILVALKQSMLHDIFTAAKETNADIYHLCDVELCRIALRLQRLSQRPKVIYDAHEPYFDKLIDYWRDRSIFKVLFIDIPAIIAERRIISKMDFLVATEENVYNLFKKKNLNSEIIYNYSTFLMDKPLEDCDKNYDIIYCGTISEAKGIFLMIKALYEAKRAGFCYNFIIVGPFDTQKTEARAKTLINDYYLTKQIHFVGQVNFDEVEQYYAQSKISFCLMPKNRSNKKTLLIKIFEYLAYGLPIVGSNFGHTNDIITKERVGVTVNPHDNQAVANAVIDLLEKARYKEMTQRCIKCVNEKYLWKYEEKKLLNLYKKLINE